MGMVESARRRASAAAIDPGSAHHDVAARLRGHASRGLSRDLRGRPILRAVVALTLALAQAKDSVPAERLAARASWYRDGKFGMFIHGVVYSLLGQGEW